MTVTAGRQADLYIAAPAGVSFTGEATTDLGVAGGAPAARQWYQITNLAKRFWNPSAAVVVERDTGGGYSVVASTEYTVRYCGGVIEFAAQQSLGTSIRVDGEYFAVAQLGQAHEWSTDYETDLLQVPQFGDAWQRRIAGIGNGSCSLSRWWADSTLMGHLTSGYILAVVLYTNYTAGSRYEQYARIGTDSVNTAVENAVEESIDLELTGRPYYYAS